MISAFIAQKLNKARYKIIDNGSYFGEIPGLKGVWASAKTLERCREELREVLEEWLILKLRDGENIPDFLIENGAKIKIKTNFPAYA
ncbi:HicB family protein [bacterium (Candidatus Gribaldobacteria) CG08_land_8_20_14_0_20_39_15]|uniref:HicB family protein n=1 Tax=bacterium (Candidatus Gribaldobacteria) CG08_land_8_20_14_0_20_39_15 TaxID=2014273 RepID=A0A2M6XUL1_9BACT|nr:MAG: HicB family protein [bacterium (Candidatus Gribaldobacteria) CG08_land_8_20_14_0_20_39_15]